MRARQKRTCKRSNPFGAPKDFHLLRKWANRESATFLLRNAPLMACATPDDNYHPVNESGTQLIRAERCLDDIQA